MNNPKTVIDFDFDPICTPYGNTEYIQLDDDWYFYENGVKVWIPKGYWSDGASIPTVFWWLIGDPFNPRFLGPAFMHDWRYLTHTTPRSVADEGLYQLCKKKTVPEWKCKCIWAAVRTGGCFAWSNNQDDVLELQKVKNEIMLRPDYDKFDLRGDY